MPTLGWITPNPAPPRTNTYVMASRFEVKSLADVPTFLFKSLSSWSQVKTARGAYGASLIAQPLKRTFWTLSAWEDRDALYAYAKSDPHGAAMRAMAPKMRSSTFIFWEADTAMLPIDWDDAKRRLAEKAREDAARGGGGHRA
ncbi:DUF3291 domain-containing protein [Streptomyces althioticus]|jgi:heme-degrading monooxygenase HmoA|uniref:DUF3291 domain-containing protein n=2 Tax=Streptomyces althioticus TaxID=83380 RepID=A0ABZ1XXB6_9ACTN|nr:DUF3291 domain-containing protein [Streptomyces sp. DSM 41972]WTB51083.1 DUF3291 domain-containing protein [Streptomyces althioticus]SCD55874.1 hypothetical protein GA0115238_11518 [Streptomyces sp. di50b]SCE39811.1 hypothetical protein GA0115245_13338 [Streptomyces sp. di188]GGQ91469.1 hypothetical protein GCM10010267_63060 [Streptomyces griseorubens]